MKSVLLFLFESADQAFDGEIAGALAEDQERRRAIYRTDVVRVQLGEKPGALDEDGRSWQIQVDGRGAFADEKRVRAESARLAVILYNRLMFASPGDCELAMVGNGDPIAQIAMLALGEIMNAALLRTCPVNTHLILLQDQLVFDDARVGALMSAIERLNDSQPPYYTDLYLLPWEVRRRPDTRRTVCALIKTMAVGGGRMMASAVKGRHWVETAAVAQLFSPVDQIARMTYDFLTGEFAQTTLEPALAPSDELRVTGRELQDAVRELVNLIDGIEREDGLPDLEELFMIMPERDPGTFLGPKDEPTPARAWEMIYSIYGEATGRALHRRMHPDADALERKYAAKEQDVAVALIRRVLDVGERRGCGFGELPTLIDGVRQQVFSRLNARGEAEPEPIRYAVAVTPGRREAVNIARTRHMLLAAVREDARKSLGSLRVELRTKMFKNAADRAKRYLSDCTLALWQDFQQMCSIHRAEAKQEAYYANHMEEAYGHWCRRSLGEHVGLPELYACFTDAVCRLPYDEAAHCVCGELGRLFDQRTQMAMDRIRARVRDFFSELKFRSELLQDLGVPGNLNDELLSDLKTRLGIPPLMCVASTDRPLKASNRMFVISKSALSAEFADGVNAAHDGASVLYDPYESGVQMVVKYAGNALSLLTVCQYNRERNEEP